MNICSRDRELLCINFKFLIFMVIPVLLVVASLVVLYFGADFLVKVRLWPCVLEYLL